MKKRMRSGRIILSLFIAATLVLSCGSVANAMGTGKINISLVGKYDSADTAAIRAVDTENKEIRLRNHTTGKTYTLKYDNTSMMYDAYGQALSPRLLTPGQVVDVTFLKSSKTITTLEVSKEAWYIESTRDHNLVRNDGTAVIRGDVYKIDSRTLVMAEGQLALKEDVLSTDNIEVYGIGKEIYSINVTSGHGYVSLSSEVVENQSLVGAWIELDNDVIYKISPNMLLSAPEGDYKLQIIGNGANYQSEVNVSRNQETVVDTSDVTIAKPKEGLVTFEIEPSNADVFVDGFRMLTGVPQTVQYGYHTLKIMADGYLTQTKYLKVGTPKSVIKIELEKEEEETSEEETSTDASSASTTDETPVNSSTQASTEQEQISSNSASVAGTVSVSGNSSASNASTSNTSTSNNSKVENYRIYFDAPYEAELYYDGSYIGMIPTNVKKVPGNHEVILKRDGYETKSYRIHIDSEYNDLSYSFPELVKIRIENDDAAGNASTNDDSASGGSTGTISGNDASGSATTGDTSGKDNTGDSAGEKTTKSDDAASEGKTNASDEAVTGDSSKEKTDNPGEGGSASASEGGTDAASSIASDKAEPVEKPEQTDEGGPDATIPEQDRPK